MDHIPPEVVAAESEKMADLSVTQVPRLVKTLEKEQPALLAYLMATDDELFNQEEQEAILYIGMVVWQIMRHGKRKLGKVSMEKIELAQDEGFKFLETLSTVSEGDFESISAKMLDQYPEPEVLRYIVEVFLEEVDDPEAPHIRDEVKGMAVIHLKIALDAMIASLKG